MGDGDTFEESQFVKQIQVATMKYQQAWERKEEKDNFEQKHDPMLIREALWPEINERVQKETLVALQPELEAARDRFEAAKSKKKKRKKKKKKKKGKKAKGKKSKNL